MTDRFPQTVGTSETDIGLRSFLLGTYRYMAIAMAFAAAVSYFGSQYILENPASVKFIYNPIAFLGLFFGIMFGFAYVGRNLRRMSEPAMFIFLFAMAGALGAFLSLSVAFYPSMLIAKVFFMTVAMFAALSLFGYSTKLDLTTAAKFAGAIFLAVIALYFVSAFTPIFTMSTGMDLVLSIVAVAVIGILIAWETQALKAMYYGAAHDPSLSKKLSIFGAASLLLSFYNMFQFLLNIMSMFSD